MSARNSIRAAATAAFVAGIALAGGVTGTFSSFSGEVGDQSNPTTFSGGWVEAPTSLSSPTVDGLGATMSWTPATQGVSGQEIWYNDRNTVSNCSAGSYNNALLTGGAITATTSSLAGTTGSPTDDVPSSKNGHYICYQVRSTHNDWWTAANFGIVQVGLVPSSISSASGGSAGFISNGDTITIGYNQAIADSNHAITVRVCTNGSIRFGATSCSAASTVGTIAGLTIAATVTFASSTASPSGSQLTITLGGGASTTTVSGTGTFTASGTDVSLSAIGSLNACTTAACKPTQSTWSF